MIVECYIPQHRKIKQAGNTPIVHAIVLPLKTSDLVSSIAYMPQQALKRRLKPTPQPYLLPLTDQTPSLSPQQGILDGSYIYNTPHYLLRKQLWDSIPRHDLFSFLRSKLIHYSRFASNTNSSAMLLQSSGMQLTIINLPLFSLHLVLISECICFGCRNIPTILDMRLSIPKGQRLPLIFISYTVSSKLKVLN